MPDKRRAVERKYDKGERRFKHAGRKSKPEIQFDERQPRKWVGKCPDNVPDVKKAALLNQAVAGPTGDREVGYIKQLYIVHEGAIYEAQTSDAGRSYHAYPYKGKLPRSLLRVLEDMAVAEGSAEAFTKWVKEYIETGGKQ